LGKWQNKHIITLEEDRSIFSIFLTWLELGDTEGTPFLKDIFTENYDKSILDLAYIYQLLRGYILGDFLLVEEFQNCYGFLNYEMQPICLVL
jgi:hypothetical protein